MSKWNGWTVEKARRSPAATPRQSLPGGMAGRLDFCSPSPVSLLRKPYTNSPDTSVTTGHRLREYHMSRQDPTILDRIYTTPSSPASPYNGYLYRTTALTPGHANGSSRSPLPTSLLRHTLTNSHRRSLPSLVNVAAHRRVSGTSRNFSPVIVRLTGPATGSDQVQQEGEKEDTRPSIDPCDKNTVISALKLKRKRWATSMADENTGHSDGQPSAKRSRVELTFPSPRPQPKAVGRKRPGEYLAIPQAVKQARGPIAQSSRQKRASKRRVMLPEIEYESDKDSEQGDIAHKPPPTKIVGKSSSLGSSRSSTPSVHEEEEISNNKRAEASLGLEKSLQMAVDPSSQETTPNFHANKTQLPFRPSFVKSATQEDLQRDRDAAAAKLREFLASDDVDEEKATSSTSKEPVKVSSQSSSTPSVSDTKDSAKPLKPSTTKSSSPASTTVSSATSLVIPSLSNGLSTPSTSTTTTLDQTSFKPKDGGIKLGANPALKTVSFSQTPPTTSVATSSPSVSSVTFAGGIPLGKGLQLGSLASQPLAVQSSQASSGPTMGGIPLGKGLTVTAFSTSSTATSVPALTFKLPTQTPLSALASSNVTTSLPSVSTTLPSSTETSLPSVTAAPSLPPVSLTTPLVPGLTLSASLPSSIATPTPSITVPITQTQPSTSGTALPPFNFKAPSLNSTSPATFPGSLGGPVSLSLPSTGVIGSMTLDSSKTSTALPSLASVLNQQTTSHGGQQLHVGSSLTSTTQPKSFLGAQMNSGLFQATTSAASQQTSLLNATTSSAPSVLSLPTLPTSCLASSGTGLLFGATASSSTQPPQTSTFGGIRFSGGFGSLQSTATTAVTTTTTGFTGATTTSQTDSQKQGPVFNFTGSSNNQAPSTFNFMGAAGQSNVGVPPATSSHGGGMGFNFTAGVSSELTLGGFGPTPSKGIFASTSSTNTTFNFSAGKPAESKQLLASAKSSDSSASTGQSTGFNFSLGAGDNKKLSFNFSTATAQPTTSASGTPMFNFSGQSKPSFGTGGSQPMDGSIFSQGNSVFNQTSTSSGLAASGGMFGQNTGANSMSIPAGGGLVFGQSQNTGPMFGQTRNIGTTNQTPVPGGLLFGQSQSTSGLANQTSVVGGGMFGQSQQAPGQSGGAVFNFTGNPTNSVFSPQPNGMNLNFASPATPAGNSFTAGLASGGKSQSSNRPIAKARRRTPGRK